MEHRRGRRCGFYLDIVGDQGITGWMDVLGVLERSALGFYPEQRGLDKFSHEALISRKSLMNKLLRSSQNSKEISREAC